MAGWLISLVDLLFALLELALFLRLILPWFRVAPNNAFYRFLVAVTEPIVEPVRGWIGNPPMLHVGRLFVDVGIVVAFFVLILLNSLLQMVMGLAFGVGSLLWLLRPGDNFGFWLRGVVDFLFQLYLIILLARLLLDLLRVPPRTPLVRFIRDATEPLLAPIRQQLRPYVGPFDFSPLILYLILYVLLILIHALLFSLPG